MRGQRPSRYHAPRPTFYQALRDRGYEVGSVGKLDPPHRPWFPQVNFTGPHDPMDVTASMAERWSEIISALPWRLLFRLHKPELGLLYFFIINFCL